MTIRGRTRRAGEAARRSPPAAGSRLGEAAWLTGRRSTGASSVAEDSIEENPTTVTLVLDGRMDAAPGQFAMLWLPGVDEKPFSIAGADPLMFTVSRVGPVQRRPARARSRGHAVGPRPVRHGASRRGRAARSSSGGGYGAAPLSSLRLFFPMPRTAPPLIEAALGARTAADLLFLRTGSRPGRGRSRGNGGRLRGHARAVSRRSSRRSSASGRFERLCACGPEGMLEALEALCREAEVPAELSHEAYMRCGVGHLRLLRARGPAGLHGRPGVRSAGGSAGYARADRRRSPFYETADLSDPPRRRAHHAGGRAGQRGPRRHLPAVQRRHRLRHARRRPELPAVPPVQPSAGWRAASRGCARTGACA